VGFRILRKGTAFKRLGLPSSVVISVSLNWSSRFSATGPIACMRTAPARGAISEEDIVHLSLVSAHLLVLLTLVSLTRSLLAVGENHASPALVSQQRESQIAEVLRSGSPSGKAAALQNLIANERLRNNPLVRDALLAEFERAAADVRNVKRDIAAGVPRGGQKDESGYELLVLEAALLVRDPRALPYFAQFVDTGVATEDTIAEFGVSAVPHLLNLWTAQHRSPEFSVGILPSGLLRTLAKICSQHDVPPALRERVRVTAQSALHAPKDWITMKGAIDLAVALGDGPLLQDVEAIAQHAWAAQARGVTDAKDAQRVSEHARQVLARSALSRSRLPR